MATHRNSARAVQSGDQEWHPGETHRPGVDSHQTILEHLPLLNFIARKVWMGHGDGVTIDELVSAGVIGLVESIARYDEKRGIKFSTFAYARIRGAMIDELRTADWFPRSAREKAKRLETAERDLLLHLGRQPTDQEMAEELGVELSVYLRQAREKANLCLASLEEIDEIADPGHDATCGERTGWCFRSAESCAEQREEFAAVARQVSALPARERRILELYFYDDLSVKEIAAEIGVTPSRVTQIRQQCIANLRAAFSEG